MKYFLRLVSATVAVSAAAFAPAAFAVEGGSGQFSSILNESPALLMNSSQGYLGIGFRDIDNDRAAALKLKETAGVEIVTVDHDAPAGAVGLKMHDVILQMNGQAVAGAEQLRRMLRETPPGRSISLLTSRDGQQQTIKVTLADHAELEQKAWTNITVVPDPDDEDGGGIALAAPTSHGGGHSFFGSLTFGSTSVGVQLDTLGSQLADYFGVKDGQGLLVKRVAANSPAATAGLKAGDVITKVDGQTMATLSDWSKKIHANRGKEVQVTIFRNRKEQTLSMQAGEAKHKGELVLPDGLQLDELLDESARARINADLAQLDASELIDPQQLRDTIEQSSRAMGSVDMQKLAEQMKEQSKQMRQQMEEMRKNLQSLQLQEMY
jgi:serine protease Do